MAEEDGRSACRLALVHGGTCQALLCWFLAKKVLVFCRRFFLHFREHEAAAWGSIFEWHARGMYS